MKKERIPGGKSKGKSLKDIAIMHSKSDSKSKPDERKVEKMMDHLKSEFKKGIKIELEHTTDENIAREIAMDHLYEDPKYYTKLSKIEEMKRPKKITLNQLSEIIKRTINEDFVGGVSYDNIVAAELKQKVGSLDKLTPYVLEIGDKVESDISGTIHVYEDGKKVKIFRDVDDFLRGIKYGPMKLKESDSFMPHQDHEAKMAKAELRDMVKNAKEIYNMIKEGDQLPGWISAYITLASDYMHSVNEYMVEHNSQGEELEEAIVPAEQEPSFPKLDTSKLNLKQFSEWLGFNPEEVKLALDIAKMSGPEDAIDDLENMGRIREVKILKKIFYDYGSLSNAKESCKKDLGI